jgi:hypothetical protein
MMLGSGGSASVESRATSGENAGATVLVGASRQASASNNATPALPARALRCDIMADFLSID